MVNLETAYSILLNIMMMVKKHLMFAEGKVRKDYLKVIFMTKSEFLSVRYFSRSYQELGLF
jgi:hypothetical protein